MLETITDSQKQTLSGICASHNSALSNTRKILKPTSIRKPYTTPAILQEKLIREIFINQKFEAPIPANWTPIGSPTISVSQIPLTSNIANLPKLDIPILEPEPEKESSSSDKEGDVEHIIIQEEKPNIEESMLEKEKPDFEAEYCFTHKNITYQGYLDPTEDKVAYQQEIDQWLLRIKGTKLETVKGAFISSLHIYPRRKQDKFLQLQYEYTPRDSATAAYKTHSTRVMGFLTGSTSSLPISPKPLQLPQDILTIKTPKAHIETVVVAEEVGVEAEKAQADHLPDCSNLQSLFKDHQKEESRSRPLMSLTETKKRPRSSLTNSTCCLKKN